MLNLQGNHARFQRLQFKNTLFAEMHTAKFNAYQGTLCRDKIAELTTSLSSQQNLFLKVKTRMDSFIEASSLVANLISKKSKSFTDGEFIK